MKRTPLAERTLPNYTRAQELSNTATHLVGLIFAIVITCKAIILTSSNSSPVFLVCAVIYGTSMLLLYSASSLYHALSPGYAKKVLQVIDHTTIYGYIAGSYTPILLLSVFPLRPALALTLLALEWLLALIGGIFTVIDHNRFYRLSMICYLGMGWGILFALRESLLSLGKTGFLLLLIGGISYSIGALLYAIGKKKSLIFHTIFHIFVDFGTLLHAIALLKFVF